MLKSDHLISVASDRCLLFTFTQPRFFFHLRWKPLVTSFYVVLFPGVGGGGPGSAHCQQVQQSGGAHAGECRTQIVGFLFPDITTSPACHLSVFNLISSLFLLLTSSPLKHSSASLLLYCSLAAVFSLPSPFLICLYPLFSLPSLPSHLFTLAHLPPPLVLTFPLPTPPLLS